MADQGTMRGIAAEYRRQAASADDPAHRIRLIVLANCCDKMAAALTRLGRPMARPGIDPMV
jgi:hypothetical protein